MTRGSPALKHIEILARNMDLTDSLKQRVESKIGKVVNKLGQHVKSTNVVLRVHVFPNSEVHSHVTKKDSQIAEVTLMMNGGSVIHVSERSEDMYASIDLVSHTTAQSLKRHKEKITERRQHRKDNNKDEASIFDVETDTEEGPFDEEVLLQDLDERVYGDFKAIKRKPVDDVIVKEKVFDMPPISVEDAMANLSLVDHDFFVFRNKVTNEINVVYKREGGGYGHIIPGSNY